MIIDPAGPASADPLAQDMRRLEESLRAVVAPHMKRHGKDLRILNLACGRCDEAETLVKVGAEMTGSPHHVEMVAADIRIREIRQARERFGHLPAKFLIEDATRIDQHRELGDDFGLVFLRHQNFWHGQEVWKKIFDQGLARLDENGLLVITSYFDKEHRLAIKALRDLGMELVESRRTKGSRSLTDAPGKSVDRWVAVFRQKA